MDITWYGQSCFRLKGKSVTVVTDPFNPEYTGLKFPKLAADIVTVSHEHGDHNNVTAIEGSPFVVRGPGEYEVKGVYVVGVETWHDASGGKERGENVAYAITIDDVSVCHIGDLGHKFSPEQLEILNGIDMLLVPVGGVYTVDAEKATEIIAQLEPSIVIPMHYQIEGLKFQLAPVSDFLKEMGKEEIQPISKLSITREKLPSETQVIVLEKQA